MRTGVAPWLIVVQDVLAGERTDHELVAGARLSDELMRLFPEGIDGAWRLYNREVDEGAEISRDECERIRLSTNDLVILVRTPGTPNFWIQLGIAAILSFVSHLLTPTPQRPRAPQQLAEQQETGTNQLAGQSNVLRPGARVPDILGRMRVYPDLLTNAVDTWTWPNTQTILQFFVIGVGDYDLTEAKLGETPLTSITSQSPMQYRPGQQVESIPAVRYAPTVDNLSLDAVLGEGDIPTGQVTFAAGPKTLTAPTALGLVVGQPIHVAATLFNNGDFFVEAVPAPGAVAPFVYVLDGPVADETVTPAITRYQPFGAALGQFSDGGGDQLTAWNQISFGPPEQYNPSPGGLTFACLAQIDHAGYRYRGRITSVYYRYDEPTTNVSATDMFLPTNIYRQPMNLAPPWGGENCDLRMWYLPEGVGVLAAAPRAESTDPLFTAWMVAALPNPDELWLDIAFPQGLIHYRNGAPQAFSVDIVAEFRRLGASAAQATRNLPTFSETRRTYLRRTVVFPVAELALPGTGPIEVRVRRVTPIPADDSDDQYASETRWAAFRAMKRLPPRVYPEVTIFRLGLQNTRAASSLGENSFNVVATRVLRSWNGAGWNPAAATDRWAENFLERCTSTNGANRLDSEIDIAGIYALQAQLDALDGGAQGKIALALDQQQDIDAELAQIADVVRAVVYRVGRKVYVSRDQANATPLALFNGRTKAAEGETVAVRMKSDDENDAVQVQWLDEASGWKMRELVYNDSYPNPITPSNVLRVSPLCANWAQAFRRAVYEWSKVKFRREQISCNVTEDGRICRPGDVVHITDDIANLALAAGEVLYISGTQLVVDRDLDFSAGGTFTILLRDIEGARVDAIPCTAVAGSPNRVQLARAPSGITIKGRDEALGTLYAFYSDANVTVRRWLLTSVEAAGASVTLGGVNYTSRVYEGDAVALPARPPLIGI